MPILFIVDVLLFSEKAALLISFSKTANKSYYSINSFLMNLT